MSDEAIKVGEKTFYSPINKENSFTAWNVAKRTKSTMTLYFDRRGDAGFIEWDIPKIEETHTIGLVFELVNAKGKRKLADYDGVFAIPEQAMDLLEENGIDCAEMRKSMAS